MNILSLDPATVCGWAHSSGASGEWDLSIRRDESKGMRLIRLRGKINEIYKNAGIDLLVYEAARNTRFQGALVVQSEFQSVIKVFCEDENIEYRGYSPTEIKKHATGKGNANKAAMMKAASIKFQRAFKSDNEADAIWLLDLAMRDYD